MQVFPAVDILGGRCVQLVQGIRSNATVYGEPLTCAQRWIAEGADALHVINLDGAFGDASLNAGEIQKIIDETGVFIQLGGGIRSVADAASWLDLGIDRVILGTLAVRDPSSITLIAEEYGSEAVMAGIDAKGSDVVISGWEERAGDYLSWADRFEKYGAGSLLYTNVDVEGLQNGIQREPVMRLLAHTRLPVIAAGGISSAHDVRTLKDLGVTGVVLGSALYSGRLTLTNALEAAL